MRIKNGAIFLFFFCLLLTVSFFPGKAFGAAGDRITPYSTWDYHKFNFQEYSFETPKLVDLQQFDMYVGEEANEIVRNENYFNGVPKPDEHWILMGFDISYISGPEEPLNASDLIYSSNNFYTTSGQKITPIDTAVFSQQLKGLGEFDVSLYPGASSKVWYGILVKKTAGLPLIRIGTGVNQTTGSTNYKWFATDPYYIEPVVASNATASSYNSIKLTWTPATGISGYDIYRSTSPTGSFTKVSSVGLPNTNFLNTGLNTGTIYYYKIKTFYTLEDGTKIYGSFSPVVSAKPVLSVPAYPKAAPTSYNSIKTSWKAIKGANGYEVYRATSKTGKYSLVAKTTTTTSFTNTGLSTNKVYYYKIRAYRMVGKTKVYSGYTRIISAKPILSVPTNFKASKSSSTSIKTTWSAVNGASGYEVYRAKTKTGKYSLVKRTTSKYYTNTGLKTGSTYYYKVRAYRKVGSVKVYSGWTTVSSARP
ncbi:fibronectin type III domain-containing protein [Mesobacillus subterraneus]|uniref:Fibronectin type-III domain-containing protein n=1 Tax=Mesobacillus subterraneus TaxID=285983 RepID=A0A3R9F921_9BACI|nr:fibronectin type III domain-containing protein [Mesobacillus subterraneus]RSD21094.1 hypothetical protein EJA10_22615 [Mesobacillus subterraneus]